MSKIEVVDLKECKGDTGKISIFLNKIESQRITYDLKSVSLTDDRNTAVMVFENAEGMSYFNMLSDAADERRNENNPASSDRLFNDAIAVLLNHTEELVRVFITEKTCNTYDRWFNVFKLILPIHLKSERIKMVEIISSYTDEKPLRDLKKHYPDRVKIFDTAHTSPNFMVIEPLGYWVEILDEKKMIRGIANFGDREGTKKLIESFEKLKTKTFSFQI